MTPPSLLLVLPSGPGDPAFNMALDEALLVTAPQRAHPVLRFYGWTEPAATFGYFQDHAEIERLTLLRPLLRRPTGGGLVPHDRDWTYALAVPPDHPWYRLHAIDSYRAMHDWIRLAFLQLEVSSELAPSPRKAAPGQCFVGHERFDLLVQGQKIAGAAQRRNRSGLLIQGSVQPPRGPSRDAWENAMTRHLPREFFEGTEPIAPDPLLLATAESLAAQRYRNPEFHRRRHLASGARPETTPT